MERITDILVMLLCMITTTIIIVSLFAGFFIFIWNYGIATFANLPEMTAICGYICGAILIIILVIYCKYTSKLKLFGWK